MATEIGNLRVTRRPFARSHLGAPANSPWIDQSRAGLAAKRGVDLILGTALAALAVPVILVLAVAMAGSLREWPFFVQIRIGRDGRPFRFVKLRTLPRSTPAYVNKYQVANVETSRLGRFLRKTHFDELPQLLLVPLGRMSLVGPRPEMPPLHRLYDPQFAQLRATVRPGCTGLWQLSTECHRLIPESPEFDLLYLRRMSTRLDLWVLWRTVLRMFGLGRLLALSDLSSVTLGRQTTQAAELELST